MAGLKIPLMIWVYLYEQTQTNSLHKEKGPMSPRASLHHTAWSKLQLRFYSENNCWHAEQNVLIQLHSCAHKHKLKWKMTVLKSYTDFRSMWKMQEVKNGLKKAANLLTLTTQAPKWAQWCTEHRPNSAASTGGSYATKQLFESSLQSNRK